MYICTGPPLGGGQLGGRPGPRAITDLWRASRLDCEIALRLLLTIPVTVASGERSFSKLKIIKNYLRTSMSQDRLCGLALLSIEHEMSSKLDDKDLIAEFAAKKARKVAFF